MILGAVALGTAVATDGENASTNTALLRECDRYHLDYDRVLQAYARDGKGRRDQRRGWWDYAIVAVAVGVFVYLGINARAPASGHGYWLVVGLVGRAGPHRRWLRMGALEGHPLQLSSVPGTPSCAPLIIAK